MKIFAIVGFTLIANSMLVNGLALKGNARQSVQTQESLSPASLADTQQEEQPMPYSFSYDAHSDVGSTSRSESADGSGKVIGTYAIKGADGISRTVSYTADSEGFRANITTNEPGTESQNPSFIVLTSSQLPAAEISRQLQIESDLAQQEEQPLEEQPELPAAAPAKSIAAPRKSQPSKSRRPAQLPAQQLPTQQLPAQQVSVPTKSRRPAQQPSKRLAAVPSKGATRARGPSKSIAAPTTTTTTTQRPRVSAPVKRPIQVQQQPQEEEAQISLSADQSEESAEDDSQEGF